MRDEPAGATPFDSDGLIPEHIQTREQLFIAEARNISKATLKYLATAPSKRMAPFTREWAYRLHHEMFGDVWAWAGKRRITQTNIGAPPHEIDSRLKDLFDDLTEWHKHKSYPLIEQAARLHHRAVLIHPFNNGNGRWSRLLANILIKRSGSAPIDWLENDISNQTAARTQYLSAIRAADEQDYAPLIALHQRYSTC
ncbi:MAG: mobile mystery protein B [Candidatus Binatus sp.]|uniref:mobile mystery protein B n=1 Tax=Candidatus Binatus sp. TaxID=2811406 RepID=UPI00271C8018|nr:mobile mystery protein B [Candidatus Binatus sp.]MDO8434807.1 mobile mystery protein B [Candidatus Binatus sp.]